MPPVDDALAVASWRAAIHAAWGEVHEPRAPHEAHHEQLVGGVRCLVAGDSANPVLVYLHGGGFVLGSPEVVIPITARLAASLHVISVDYRLAPEHPFPAALNDVLAVCRAVGANGAYALAGDSAGGGLALAAAQLLASEGSAPPCSLALLCPYLDLGTTSTHVRAYLGGVDANDPRVSPLRGALAGIPPTLVQTGTADELAPQAERLVGLGAAAGAVITLDVWREVWHTWQYHRDIPESDAALAAVRDFVARHCPATD